jgi:hypothetical protein
MGLRLLALTLVAVACAACAGAGDEVAEGAADLSGESPALDAIRTAVANVDEPRVSLGDIATPIENAKDGTRGEQGSLFDIDWHQKWPGGRSGDHAWETGTPAAKRCAWASLLRFEAILGDPPPELRELRAKYTNWNGAFHNWNDDYSGSSTKAEPAYGDAKTASIVASRPDAVNWVSATAKDGSCLLPTRKILVDWAKASLVEESSDPRRE